MQDTGVLPLLFRDGNAVDPAEFDLLRAGKRLCQVVQNAGPRGERLVRTIFSRQLHRRLARSLGMRPAGRFVQRQTHSLQLVKRKRPVIPPQPVEAVLPDIRQHLRLQNLVRQPEEQEPACLGRRNVQKFIVQQRDLCAELRPQQRCLRLQPFLQRRVDRRPCKADDLCQMRDLLRLAPAGKGEEHVRPHHQPERIVRMLRGELAQRVDGIARPFAPQLQIADLEAVQPSDRQLRQRKARLRVR